MKRIKELRKLGRLSQRGLAEKLGVARSTVAMWETGASQPDNRFLIELADVFDVSADYLLGRTDNPAPPTEKPLTVRQGGEILHEEILKITNGVEPTDEELRVLLYYFRANQSFLKALIHKYD